MLAKEHEDFWKARYAEWHADKGAQARFTERMAKREAVRPEILSLLEAFLNGACTFADFQKEFDRRTRKEWEAYGVAGPSGAMVFNKWAKHVPDLDELASVVRQVLRVPENETVASLKLANMREYLLIETQDNALSKGEVALARVSTIVSAIWMIQDSQQWPGMYTSGPNVLNGHGFVWPSSKTDPAFYLAFRAVVLELCQLLDASPDAIGFMLYWLDAEKDRGHIRPEKPVVASDSSAPRIWLIGAETRARKWPEWQKQRVATIGWSGLGDLSKYKNQAEIAAAMLTMFPSKEKPMNNSLACYEFAHVMKPGDHVFVKSGRSEIVGYGVVSGEYRFEPSSDDHAHVRSVEWKREGRWKPRERQFSMKTLTEISRYPQLVTDICRALQVTLSEDTDEDFKSSIGSIITVSRYSIEHACEDLFMSEEDIEEALGILKRKKSIVLQGPPGVGKTFVAERLAYLLLEEKDPEQVTRVQFHQSYGYEDFVRGFRPTGSGGFELRDGPFLRFADKALEDQDSPYVMVIDEINRGNLSRIFGELLTLIEADKRSKDWGLELAYSKPDEERFFVPPNLYFIGMMNTADRSLAMVDYALRRRFGFIDVEPAFATQAFDSFLKDAGVPQSLLDHINQRLTSLNKEIGDDPNLGKGFCIGHSYFCPTDGEPLDEVWYERIVQFEIVPLLREYWFDARDKVTRAQALLNFGA